MIDEPEYCGNCKFGKQYDFDPKMVHCEYPLPRWLEDALQQVSRILRIDVSTRTSKLDHCGLWQKREQKEESQDFRKF